MLRVDVTGLEKADTGLRRFAATVEDLTPFWRTLAERLADDAQSRWPLRRRTGKLRRSLTWAGKRLGRGGIFRSRPDRLTFGTRIFYGKFSHFGAVNQPVRELLHVDPAYIGARLDAWTVERARAAGFIEVTT